MAGKILKRRREGKTDYKARINLLKSEKDRIVYRRSNKYINGQCIKNDQAKDKIVCVISSKKLLEFGWPEKSTGNLKSIPASYLTGFLLGKVMSDKGVEEGNFDLGLTKKERKSRAFAFLKGVVDSGIKVNCGEKMFPEDERIGGKDLKEKIDIKKIKENIEKKYK